VVNKAARKWYLAAMNNEWPYLSTNEAKSRCVIAAHYLNECDNLVEIGGYLTPIHEFLSPAGQEIWVFDPKLPEKDFSLGMAPAIQVRQRPLRFQAAKMPFKAGSYGLVLLGCSLKFDKKDPADKIEGLGKLREWAQNAKVIVLEYAKDWEPAREVARLFADLPSHESVLNIGLSIPVSPPDEPEFGDRILQIWVRRR
jgi:hypothetical protein